MSSSSATSRANIGSQAHPVAEISLPRSLLAVMALSSQPVRCDAGPSSAPSASTSLTAATKRLPIYDQPQEPVTLVETHTELERQIGSLRRSLVASTASLQSRVQDATSAWIARERAVEQRVRALTVPDEPLNPNLLYVGVATLAASVFTRYRAFPIRFLAPPLLFVGSLNYFLPKTAHNLGAYYVELEQRYAPSLTQPRRELAQSTSRLWNRTEGLVGEARDAAAKGVKSGLEHVEKGTGLRVGEVLAKAKAEAADAGDARRLI